MTEEAIAQLNVLLKAKAIRLSTEALKELQRRGYYTVKSKGILDRRQ